MIKMKRVKVITMAEKGNIYFFFKWQTQINLNNISSTKSQTFERDKNFVVFESKRCLHASRLYTRV